MSLRIWIHILISLVLILWHGFTAYLLEIAGAAPDFPLIWLSLLCLRYRSKACIGWGFTLGLFMDLTGGGLLGLHAFSLSLAGYAGSQISGVPRPGTPFSIRITLMVALSLMDSLIPLLFLVREAEAPLGAHLMRTGFPGFIYTLVVGICIHAADAYVHTRRGERF